MTGLQAGVGRSIITPPIGAEMGGYGARDHGCEGIHDDLTATALVLDDGHTRAAIVALDLIAVDESSVARIRALVEQHAGIPRENVALCCSHTHAGPEVRLPSVPSIPGQGVTNVRNDAGRTEDTNVNYVRVLEGLVATAVVKAARHMAPVAATLAFGTTAFNINRRLPTVNGYEMRPNPDGAVDRRVWGLRIDRAGPAYIEAAPMATVFAYGCHATFMGSNCYEISADYIGQARRCVEAVYAAHGGTVALFLQGCCANVRPHVTTSDGARFRAATFSELQRAGYELGAEVIRIIQRAEPVALVPLVVASKRVTLPLQSLTTILHRPWVASTIARQPGPVEPPAEAPRAMQGEVMVLRMGELCLVTLPGEIFVETGWRVADTLPTGPERTLVTSCSNGSVGYVPTPQALQEGGYEAFPFGRERGVVYCDDVEERLVAAAREAYGKLFLLS